MKRTDRLWQKFAALCAALQSSGCVEVYYRPEERGLYRRYRYGAGGFLTFTKPRDEADLMRDAGEPPRWADTGAPVQWAGA